MHMRNLLAKRSSRIAGMGIIAVLALAFGTVFLAGSAESSIQVSNLDQTLVAHNDVALGQQVNSSQYVAQAFTTGDNSPGYILDSIQIKILEGSSDEAFITLHIGENDRPGAKVYDLTGDLSSTGNQSFSAPANASLAANTQYFVLIGLDSGATDVAELAVTASGDEDAGAASGWSIDERLTFFESGSSVSTTSAPGMIAVVAEAREPVSNSASGQPVITTPHGYWVGQELSAGFGNITDPDGLTAASPSYQWIVVDVADGTEVIVMTNSKYTLTEEDEGKQLYIQVLFIDDAGNTESLLNSDLTPVIDPVPNILVSTLDTPAANDRLQEIPTYSGGQWAQLLTTGDNSGGYTPTHVYVSIGESGGSASAPQPRVTLNASVKATKTLVDNADIEISIPGAVLYTLSGDIDEGISSSETVIFSFPADASLTAETEYFIVFSNNGGLTPSYNIDATVFEDEDEDAASGWQINFGGLYTLASNPTVADWGIETSYSAKIAVTGEDKAVIVNHLATGAPTINGTARVGETLTASTSAISDTDGLTNVNYAYQWIRIDGNLEINISSGTSSTYQVVAADQGKTLKVQVSFTDDDNNAEGLFSAATAPVAAAAQGNNPASGAPTVNGTARVGETLTASTSTIADDDGLTNVSYSYQWIRVDGNSESDIASAISSTYQVVAADVSKTLKVQVSFTDDDSNAETLTSIATSTVVTAVQVNNPASGAPTINGTARVGETLTASTSTIADDDGLTNVSYSYQWIRVDGNSESDIASAISSTYQVVAADVSKTLKVKVSFTDDDSNAETLTSIATSTVVTAVQVNNPASGAPTINGTARVGETLTAGTVTIADADGLSNVSYTYQWIRVDGSDESNIASATSSTYLLATADVGKRLKVKVSFDDDDDNAETLTSGPTSIIADVAQINNPASGMPTISGTARAGETLTAGTVTIADADGLSNVSYTYQWIRVDGNSESNIASAIRQAYQLTTADVGKRLKVKVSFTDDDNNAETLTSAPSLVIAAAVPINNPASGAPTISGTARAGQTLTAGTVTIADADDLSNVSYTYQWLRVDGNNESNIADATSSTYQLVTADIGKRIKVKVSFSDDDSNSEMLTSAATSTVVTAIQLNSPASGAPTISGTARAGQTLTAGTATIADADGLANASYSYQWIRVDGSNESNIANATSSTYRLVTADIGKRIKVKVSFSDDNGYAEDLTSAASSVVARSLPKKRRTNNSATGAPTISGTARVGETLTADTNTINDDDGLSNASYSYQWIRVDGNSERILSGGTSSSYRLVAADVGKRLKVRVSFEDDRGYAEELTSAITSAVATVAQPNNPATGAPIITGLAYIGQTLTADIGTIADADSLTNANYSYQWIRVDGSKESIIVGATSLTYRLLEANINKRLKVRVSFEDDRGYAEELTSAATIVATVYVEEEREEEGDPPIAPIAPDEEDNKEEEELELDNDEDNDEESDSSNKDKDDTSASGTPIWIVASGAVVVVAAVGAAAWYFLMRRPTR